MVLWQCKELCVNFKISQHYTCRRHFRHGKRFFQWLWELCGLSLIRNPYGTMLFHSQHLPSFIFVSVCFAFHVFLSILLYFPFECLPITTAYKKENFLQIIASQMFLVNAGILLICQSSGPAISTTQRFYSAQMFPSDDDTKASNTESVPPEWRPTPHIIVYASPFPC